MTYLPTEEDLALLKSRSKRLYCRIELLNKNYQIIDMIEGLALSGSNSIDADSDTRRTFNLDIFPKKGFSISQFSTEEWTSKMLRLRIGMKAPTSESLIDLNDITSSGNKHIPAGGSAGQILRWSSDGTAQWGNDNNTTYSAFKGATSSAAGGSGLVPAPTTTNATQYLRGDGTWATPPDTKYNNASTSSAGLMSSGDKAKLDGIAANANNYAHPTSAGNKHIPAGGSAGQILRWSADGTAQWGNDNNTTYSDMKGATTEAAGVHGLAPAPAAGAANRYLCSDGTWKVPPDTNTTYGTFKAATASAAGGSGLVPAPAAGKQGQYLRGDGTWSTPTNTTYSDATQSTHGLMSTSDKKKLDGFGAANTYALKSDITAMYRYKGSVASTDKLPTSGQTIGDVYDVGNGMNYAWNGSKWDALGEIFTITKITNTEIDNVLAS